jgi:hypothetical protein
LGCVEIRLVPSSYSDWITTQMLWQRTLHKRMYGIAPFVSASLMLLARTNWAKRQRELVLTRFIANYLRKVLYNLALSLN